MTKGSTSEKLYSKMKIIKWFAFWPFRVLASYYDNKGLPSKNIDLKGLFEKLSKEKVSFIQIGANDGLTNDKLRDSILKYQWEGILVEPVPYVFRRLLQNYKGVHGLIFENCAISETSGKMMFYSIDEYDEQGRSVFEDFDDYKIDQLGSFDRKTLLKHSYMHRDFEKLINEIEVPCLTFHDLVEKYKVEKLELLLVDAEGYDHKIIHSINFDKISPRVIIFEHHHLNKNDYRKVLTKLNKKYDFFLDGWDTIGILKSPN